MSSQEQAYVEHWPDHYLLVFVGHAHDAREQANCIEQLRSGLQAELDRRLEARRSGETPASKWDHEYTFGHTILFMEEYHQGTMEILGRLSGEIEHVG